MISKTFIKLQTRLFKKNQHYTKKLASSIVDVKLPMKDRMNKMPGLERVQIKFLQYGKNIIKIIELMAYKKIIQKKIYQNL